MAEATRPTAEAAPERVGKLPIPVVLFLLALIVPLVPSLGALRLSPYRIVLLVAIVPLLLGWLRGRAGRIRLADFALLLMCAWIFLSFAVIHGGRTAVEGGGIVFVETMGAYLLARVYIRSAEQFRAMVALMFLIVLFLLPLAVYETLSSQNILLDLADAVGTTFDVIPKAPRWGLDRVQGPFEHPILYGVFTGSILSLTYMVLGYGRSRLRRWVQSGVVLFTAGLSLSSGPLSAMMAQVMLLGWDGLLRKVRQRWALLAGGILCVVVAVEAAANRSTAQIFISYFAFSQSTGYNRLRIWTYGSASVLNHPLLGVGLNDWERPPYMLPSIDMFWLVPAVRHGLPAALLLQLAVFSIFLSVAFRRGLTERVDWYRIGFLICIVGYYLAGWTVHYWNATYVLLFFLLGSGVWILDEKPKTAEMQVQPDRRATTAGFRRDDGERTVEDETVADAPRRTFAERRPAEAGTASRNDRG